jgi:hypothetical protein
MPFRISALPVKPSVGILAVALGPVVSACGLLSRTRAADVQDPRAAKLAIPSAIAGAGVGD